MPLVSIVVPVYNSGAFLEPCIKSLLAQTYRPIEIILVEDGSTDGSRDICQQYAKEYSSLIRMIDGPGTGANAGRWAGIQSAKGDFVLCCDSDDLTDSHLIATLYRAICTTGLPMACCKYGTFTDMDTPVNSVNAKLDNCPEAISYTDSAAIDSLLHNKNVDWGLWNKLYLRDVLTEDTFISDITFNEDLLTNFKLISSLPGFAYIEVTGYYYRQHTGSISRRQLTSKMLDDQMAVASYIRTRCQGTKLQESAEAFAYEKQLYLLSLIYRSPRKDEFSNTIRQYKQDLKKDFPTVKGNASLSFKMKLAAILCLYFSPAYQFLCKKMLENR